jgi:hypothetical protein
MTDWKNYLESIYYDVKHPASYAGPKKLYRVVKKEGKFDIGQHRIRQWLQNQEAYSLQRPVRRKFKRNRVIVYGIDDQWDVDLMDMKSYQHVNDKIQFVLVAIDIFTRHLWVEPLPSKKAQDVVDGFQRIFAKGRKPVKVRSDKGTEFANKTLDKYFQEQDVYHFFTQNEPKANYAERVIRTIKSRITRYMTHKQTHRYVDILQDVAKSYNSTYHRGIGMTPDEANTLEAQSQLWLDNYAQQGKPTKKKKQPFKFKIGDHVRISHLRTVFTREYDQTWTGEVYKISNRFLREGIPLYVLKDYQDEDVVGTFYQPELQKVVIDPDKMWKIEKVLKTRTRKGVGKEYLVRWLHWPKKYDSWVSASAMTDL